MKFPHKNFFSSYSSTVIVCSRSAQVCSLADAVPPSTVMTVFTPLVRDNTLVVPPIFSLAVSPGSQILVTEKGGIFVVGENSISLHSYSAGTEHHLLKHAIKDDLSFCSVCDHHRILDSDTASCDAIIISSKGSTPKMISIIPFSDFQLPVVRVVRIHLHTLAALIPPGTTELSLFPPGSVDHRYLSIPPGHNTDAAIDLMVGTGCCQLVVVPVYNMVSKHERFWKVSVMTSHKLVTKDLEKPIHSLLTPPPSPPHSPKTTTVLADVSEPPSAMSLPAQSNTDSLAKRLSSKNAVAIPPLALPRKSVAGVIRCLALVTTFIIWFLKAGLMRCLPSFVMLGLRRGFSGEIHFHEEEKDVATVVSQDIEPSVEEDEHSVADEHVMNLGDDEDKRHSASSSPLIIDIPPGEVRMLLQPLMAGRLIENVRITLCGNPVIPLIEVLSDGTSLIRFGGGESGGRVSLVGL